MHMYFQLHFNMRVKERRRRKVKLVILMMASRPWGNWTMGRRRGLEEEEKTWDSITTCYLYCMFINDWSKWSLCFKRRKSWLATHFLPFSVHKFLSTVLTHILTNAHNCSRIYSLSIIHSHYKHYTKCKTNNINWWYCMLKLCTISSYLMGNQWNWTCFNFLKYREGWWYES